MVAIVARVLVLTLAAFLLKIVIKQLDPFQTSFYLGVALLLITIPVMIFADKPFLVSLKLSPLVALCSLGFAVGYLLLAIALKTQGLGFTEVLGHAYLPLVVLLSWLFLHEELHWYQWTGVGLVVSGVVLLAL